MAPHFAWVVGKITMEQNVLQGNGSLAGLGNLGILRVQRYDNRATYSRTGFTPS